MTSQTLLPATSPPRRLGVGYRVGLAFILSAVIFDCIIGLTELFAPGKLPASALGYIVLTSVTAAVVIVFPPAKLKRWTLPFIARLWNVLSYVLAFEGTAFVLSMIVFKGDGQKIATFWANGWESGAWMIHGFMCAYLLNSVGFLLTGVEATAGGADDDSDNDWSNHDSGPICNIDGTPMVGGVDIHGNLFGVTSTSFDSSFDSSPSSSIFDD